MALLRENHEPLVQVSLYPEKILARSWYYGEGLKGSIPEVWLREGTYERLLVAAESLPEGLRLVIWDGWRSYELQSELYNTLFSRLKAKGLPDSEAHEQARVFVATPSRDDETVSGHLTGGAVDLTLADKFGHYLPMGGSFDDTEEHSHTRYYDNPDNGNVIARENRKTLLRIMEGAGFTNYPSEWWHYDYGNRAWAERTGTEYAFYGYTEPPFKWR